MFSLSIQRIALGDGFARIEHRRQSPFSAMNEYPMGASLKAPVIGCTVSREHGYKSTTGASESTTCVAHKIDIGSYNGYCLMNFSSVNLFAHSERRGSTILQVNRRETLCCRQCSSLEVHDVQAAR